MEAESVDEVLAKVPARLGISFVPKIFYRLKHRPAELLNVWQMVEQSLLNGKLHRITKEMIFIITAKEKHCRYCNLAHRAMARELGLAPTLLNALDGDLRTISPDSLKWMMLFSRSLASNETDAAKDYMDRMKESGVAEGDIEEVIMMVAVASMMTTLANGMDLNQDVDQEFLRMLN